MNWARLTALERVIAWWVLEATTVIPSGSPACAENREHTWCIISRKSWCMQDRFPIGTEPNAAVGADWVASTELIRTRLFSDVYFMLVSKVLPGSLEEVWSLQLCARLSQAGSVSCVLSWKVFNLSSLCMALDLGMFELRSWRSS